MRVEFTLSKLLIGDEITAKCSFGNCEAESTHQVETKFGDFEMCKEHAELVTPYKEVRYVSELMKFCPKCGFRLNSSGECTNCK